ncbi:MAG: aspartate carbamoyltransferase catalytic subunit [Deltaproteobacteria bacterium]|nr:aspartate carbamoyltransferase catalytic subunit [Deltaproteobacteria bacterium]
MIHALSIDDFDERTLRLLLSWGKEYFEAEDLAHNPDAELLAGRRVALWFDEPSTRTSLSFEAAVKNLGGGVVRIDEKCSSAVKGESWGDTAAVLAELGCSALVIRTSDADVPSALAEEDALSVINAGNGTVEHPTQAIGDLLCLELSGYLSTHLKLAIVGDSAHSRVANSHFRLLPKCGIDVTVCAPAAWLPGSLPSLSSREKERIQLTTSLEEALSGATVAMYLRVQKERHADNNISLYEEFIEKYQLRSEHLSRYPSLKMVMHPGPVNWGIEISPSLRNSPKCAILRQVRCGVAMRMALLRYLLGGEEE